MIVIAYYQRVLTLYKQKKFFPIQCYEMIKLSDGHEGVDSSHVMTRS